MLAPEPAQRLGSVAAVRQALARAHLTPTTMPPRTTPTTGPPGQVPRDRSPGTGRQDLAAPDSRALAPSGVPRVLAFVIWFWTLMAAGMFWMIEMVALPLFFMIVGQGRRHHKAHRRKRLAARQLRATTAVRGVRRRIEALSERYDPSRPALRPGDDDR